MPELPEVETIARQLNEAIRGQRLIGLEVRKGKSFPHWDKALGGGGIVSKKVTKVWRSSKMLVIEFEDEVNLLVHLKMTGQLIYHDLRFTNKDLGIKRGVVGGHQTGDWAGKLPGKHTRVILEFEKGKLFFNDMRMFGWMKMVSNKKLLEIKSRKPPDVVDKDFTEKYLRELLKKTRRVVKIVIMDQNKMGGVGNIYASDALWKAKIDPGKDARSLDNKEIKKLYWAIREVIGKGIRLGGASESDFVHLSGMGGKYQKHFLVYNQEGKKCQRENCKGVIEKIRLGGRGTYFCPKCQK